MPLYRKKPVVIEARQLDGTAATQHEIGLWVEDASNRPVGYADLGGLTIDTLEGKMTAADGDFVIKGVKGEFYPCKPDIFEKTYEPVTDDIPA